MTIGDDVSSLQTEFEVEDAPKKPIKCIKFSKHPEEESPTLIFTHGAGGTIKTDAVTDFALGFAKHASALCFQGNMNLNSRVHMFETVRQDQGIVQVLGGRSMGARAAVMAMNTETSHLVLVSYPLQPAGKPARDQILLDVPSHIRVLFISGDRDSMCDIDALNDVRGNMACESWLCVVNGADHGMKVKPAKRITKTVQKTGEIAALWVQESDALALRTDLVWNVDSDNPETVPASTPEAVSASKRKRAHGKDLPTQESDSPKSSRRKRQKSTRGR